jgi:hypothetical protein
VLGVASGVCNGQLRLADAAHTAEDQLTWNFQHTFRMLEVTILGIEPRKMLPRSAPAY